MEYDENYGYEDDLEAEPVEEPAGVPEEMWNASLMQGLTGLERRLGRKLTHRELEGVIAHAEEQYAQYPDLPDVEDAFETHTEVSGKNYDLSTDRGRTDFMAERMKDAETEAEWNAEDEENWVIQEPQDEAA